MPVSKAAFAAASKLDDAVDLQRFASALTCVVLYAIVVELVVKHIWEQECAAAAKHDHNLHRLFMQLREETRRDVEALYDKCCRPYKSAMDMGRQQGAKVVAVGMASLEEALRWNEEAVKNLKYEMTPHGRSVPAGAFWSSKQELIWVLPSNFPNFAIELTRWAADRAFTSP